jgi:hypothetical protein
MRVLQNARATQKGTAKMAGDVEVDLCPIRGGIPINEPSARIDIRCRIARRAHGYRGRTNSKPMAAAVQALIESVLLKPLRPLRFGG